MVVLGVPFLVVPCLLECDLLDFHPICQDHHLISKGFLQGCLQDHLATFKGHHRSWDHYHKALVGDLLVDPLQEGEWDFLGHTQAVGHL